MIWVGVLTVDQIQRTQGVTLTESARVGGQRYTCALLSVGSIENRAPRRFHMSGNNRGKPRVGSLVGGSKSENKSIEKLLICPCWYVLNFKWSSSP